MTEISKITSTNTTANIEPKKTGEIKPNETGLKQDTVDISSSKKNIKKCALIATAISTAGSAIALAVMIGRNPAKAAKVLKGNSEFTNEIYKEGNKLADELLHREGTFKTSLNDCEVEIPILEQSSFNWFKSLVKSSSNFLKSFKLDK